MAPSLFPQARNALVLTENRSLAKESYAPVFLGGDELHPPWLPAFQKADVQRHQTSEAVLKHCGRGRQPRRVESPRLTNCTSARRSPSAWSAASRFTAISRLRTAAIPGSRERCPPGETSEARMPQAVLQGRGSQRSRRGHPCTVRTPWGRHRSRQPSWHHRGVSHSPIDRNELIALVRQFHQTSTP